MEKFYGLQYPERIACDVIEEMRICFKTLNFAALSGLIEEIQVICNRMEAALERKKEINRAEEYVRNLKKEIEELEMKQEILEK